MLSVSVRVLPSVANVSREAWNSLYPPTVENWDFFRSCEIAPVAGFSTSVLAAFAGEQLVGAAPLFHVTFPLDMAVEPRLRPLASKPPAATALSDVGRT